MVFHQRLDLLREARLSPDVLSMYDVFLGSLSSELERCGPRILQYWLNLNVADGIVFDQLVHAILHFGLGCADFNALDEKAFKPMFDFAGTLATAVNGPQTMESEAENPPSDSEPLALDQQWFWTLSRSLWDCAMKKKHSRFEQYNVTTLQGASMSMRVVFVVPSTDWIKCRTEFFRAWLLLRTFVPSARHAGLEGHFGYALGR